MDDIKLAGKKHNIDPMWKVLNKEVDLGEPTSFLDHVYLGCTQRQCEISKDTVDNYRTMFESRISAGGVEKLPFPQNLRISSWSYDMVGHAKKCVERYCELANKTTQQLYKVSTPCIDDHHFKEEEMKSVGELSQVCSQILLKCLYLARSGRPDILWSVNKLARAITKWTKACDKRLNRLISYIHHTSEYKQYCYVKNTAKQCRLGLFQDSDFAGDLEDSKSTSGGTLSWYFMVCEQTCACYNKMDKILWQTLGGFDLLHSSHMWIQAILLCGKHSTTMQIRIVSRLWFCRRLWRLKINIRWNYVHFRKPNICANKFDVQVTDISLTQLNRSWSYFSRCRFTHGRDSRSRSLGFSDWSISFLTEPNKQNQRCKRATGKPVGKHSTKHAKTDSNHTHQSRSDQHWSRSIKRNTFWFQYYVVCLWG